MLSCKPGFGRFGRVALGATAMATALVVAPNAAFATHAAFTVTLVPASNGGATATLSDTIVPGNRYLLTLTAAGAGTCGFPGATVQIADFDVQGFANPVTASVSGACTLTNASVTYTITWTGLPGSSGQFPVYCTWVLGTQQCSLTTVRIAVPG